MWRKFHFSLPDSEYLTDAPGLLTYLVSLHVHGSRALAFLDAFSASYPAECAHASTR